MKINFTTDPPLLTITLSNGCSIQQFSHPQTNEPVSESNFLDVAQSCVSPSEWESYLKLQGVNVEGVMCSATKDDQAGLLAVWVDYMGNPNAFHPTRFEFANGNTLVLTKDNLPNFRAVWGAYRRQFFST
jgi:hypothetical protein